MAFEFDERIHGIITDDRTVDKVDHYLWCHYDDVKNHEVRLSKAEWDYFHRLLLLLKSDGEISTFRTKHWAWDNALAWVAVVAYACLAFRIGWCFELLLATLPFGLISTLINQYRARLTSYDLRRHIALTPFASYSQIRWARRQLPDFVKRPYRKDIHGRPIRRSDEEFFKWIVALPSWLIFSPVILFLQGFPIEESTATPCKPPKSEQDHGVLQ